MRTYFNILAYGKSHYRYILYAMVFMLIYTFFSAFSLLSVIPFLEILFSPVSHSPAPPPVSSFLDFSGMKVNGYYYLNQWVQSMPDKNTVLVYYCVFLLICILIKNTGRYFGDYFMAPFEQTIVRNIRTDVFRHLTKMELPFFTGTKKGSIISLMVSDIQVIQEAVIMTVMNLIREPLTMLTFLFAMVIISWQMTLFSLIVLPVTGLFLNFIAKKLKRRARLGQEALGNLTGILDEFISGIRIVKSFQKESYELEKFNRQNDEYSHQFIAFRRRVELASPVTEIISVMIVCIILLYGGNLILSQNQVLKPQEFIGFIALFSQFMLPIKNVSTGISKINKALVSYQRIETLLQTESTVKEADNAVEITGFQKEITFRNVSFRYKDEVILQQINLTIPAGKTVAVVGPSGGGKSTLVDLIPRFYDPFEGEILLDGVDIKTIKTASLRRLIGYVTQEGVLFHDTIRNNIAYGVENATDEAVIQAAKVAHADRFIDLLPEKYNTVTGERGTMLSGGQRQRIAIARAVFRNPPVLILDEATSSLDTESEQVVQQALDEIMQSRTAVVIAHRLSTILKADKIVVIDKGRIVQEGTHSDLIEKGGLYKKLYEMQFQDEK